MKIGIAGYGFIGKLHLLSWKSIYPNASYCVIDPRIDNVTKEKLIKNKVPYFETFKEALEQIPDVEYLSICSPPNQHKEFVLEAAEKGIHILLEKPVSASSEDYKIMQEAISKSKSKLMIGVTQRFYPEVIHAKDWIEKGMIGNLISIQDVMILSNKGLPSWYYNIDIAGGGIFITNGVHILDRILYLSDSEMEEIDHYKLYGEDQIEKIVSFRGRLSEDIPINLHLEWSQVEKKQSLVIYGTKGRIEIETWNAARLYTEKGTEVFNPYQNTDSFSDRTLRGLVEEIKFFMEGINSNNLPHNLTLQGHKKIMDIIWSIYNR